MPIVTGGTQLIDAQDVLENKLGLRAGMTFADLGVGTAAHITLPASQIVGPDGKVYAIDILKSVLSALDSKIRREGITNTETVWSDLEVYGAAKVIANDSVDCLAMVNLLFQTTQDEHIFNEANRMLKNGGHVVVIDWLPSGGSFGPPEKERTTIDKVRQMAKVVNWREVENFSPGPYHFGVIFEK